MIQHYFFFFFIVWTVSARGKRGDVSNSTYQNHTAYSITLCRGSELALASTASHRIFLKLPFLQVRRPTRDGPGPAERRVGARVRVDARRCDSAGRTCTLRADTTRAADRVARAAAMGDHVP